MKNLYTFFLLILFVLFAFYIIAFIPAQFENIRYNIDLLFNANEYDEFIKLDKEDASSKELKNFVENKFKINANTQDTLAIKDKNTAIIFIPKIKLLEKIYLFQEKIGVTSNVNIPKLENSLWHKDNGNKIFASGNTLILGHRYSSSYGAGPFYHLDKLENGDSIFISYGKKIKKYSIFNSIVVDIEEIEIEYDTLEEMITLYTCHPLNSLDKRLVLKAKPI